MTSPKSRRVLIVDDSLPARLALAAWVRRLGHDAVVVGDADSAWREVCEERFDAVICDMRMPVHDGEWLIRRMAALSPAPPVVLATSVDVMSGDLTLRRPVVSYLVKPFRMEDLQTALVTAFDAVDARMTAADTASISYEPDAADVNRWIENLEVAAG